MAEAEADPTPGFTRDLARIEAAVASGNTDLAALGFWRVVARVKPDRVLVDRYADQIGRIDTAAFRAAVRLRTRVWVGNAVLLLASLVGLAAAIGARFVTSSRLAGLLVLGAGLVWTVSLHSPTHWAVGRFIDVRFTEYFLGGPKPPRPGLKTDYGSYLRADPGSRAWMHASGAVVTKIAPLLALVFWPGSGAPWWSAAALIAVCLLSVATDVAFSVKVSDWKKYRRERAIARARAAI